MLQHSLLLIYRNFRRFKSTFFINLIGLSTGLACALLIYLWVNDELSIDKFHAKDNQLFQVMVNHQQADGITTGDGTPGLLADALANELPEVDMVVTGTNPSWFGNFILSFKEDKIKAKGQFVGKDYFNVFSYDLIKGDKNQVLADKSSMVISETLAMRLFHTTENVIGKTLEWQLLHFTNPVVITGIFKDVPANSSDQFEFVLSFEVYKDMLGDGIHWGNYNTLTYLTLKKGTDIEQFNAKIEDFVKQKAAWSNITLFAKPYSDKYLYGKYENGVQVGGRIEYVKLFSVIAIFILLIACINFMNLSTAKASRRIKEVGIKKALGAGRKALIYQYLGESLLMAFFSLLMAIILVQLFLPQFNQMTGKQLNLNFDVNLIYPLLGITLFTGLIAGSYPALYLSGFNPAIVLKGKFNSSVGELWARKGLVVFQFTLSVILIVSVMVVYKQIAFVQNKNLGYTKDNIIIFPKEGKAVENLETFLSELKTIPGIVNATSTSHSLVEGGSYTTDLNWEGKNPDDIIRFENVTVYYDLIETLGIEMKEGRSFSRDFGTEESKIIFNEAALDILGLQNPIGQTVNLWGEDKEIIGVVKNFHFESLHEEVRPMFFRLDPEFLMTIVVKIEAGKERETISRLQEFYQAYNPGYSLDYKFLDEDYQAQYVAEQRVAVLSRYFAGLAILISCLGLFGLAAFTAERRLKEIGIRKILGSSDFSIVYLLSSDFTKMVLLAIFIALPVSYFITKNWLDSFAYRIDLEWWYFISAGLLALFIAWFTVGLQTVKAAKVNPAQCLKDE